MVKNVHCPHTRSGITCVNYPGPDCDCMAAKNLKPCPFCGGAEIKLYRGGGKLYAQCQACHACGPDHDDDNLHWDIRHVPTSPSKEP